MACTESFEQNSVHHDDNQLDNAGITKGSVFVLHKALASQPNQE